MYYFNSERLHNNYLHEPLIFPNAITDEQCDAWIKAIVGSGLEIVKGDLQDEPITTKEVGNIDPEIRIVEKYEFFNEDDSPIVPEIMEELEAIYLSANEYFKFDIHGIEECVNLLHYKHFPEGAGHYVGHTDFGDAGLSTRKLTCIIQLTDTSEYEGCDLVLNDYDHDVPRDKGTAIVFPSYMLHEVKPIIKGERFCINSWCAGPPFR